MSPRHACALGRRGRSRAPSQATRSRVIQATAELIETQGYERISMAEIAEQAGIVQRTLRHYFPDKRSILLELIDEWSERLASDRRSFLPAEVATGDDSRAAVGLILRRTDDLLRHRRWIHAEIFALLRRDEEVRHRCEKVQRAIAERFAAMIHFAQQCGALRREPDPLLESFLMLTAVERLIGQASHPQPTRMECERVLQELTDMLCRHLAKDR